MSEFLTPDSDSTNRRNAPHLRVAWDRDGTTSTRKPPHNLEAEQALLGAILFDNEALGRVSFLEPHHFFDPLHQQIYETAAKLIRADKVVTPVTLRTFFERAEPISPNLTVPQYLGTLAMNATTTINAEAYGRLIYDLATRRSLIIIGEDAVTTAYDSPVDLSPQAQIQEVARRIDDLHREQSERSDDEGLLFAGHETCGSSVAYYIKALIPADSIIAVYGATTVGKSFWVCDALWHVATGKPTAGAESNARPCSTSDLRDAPASRTAWPRCRNSTAAKPGLPA